MNDDEKQGLQRENDRLQEELKAERVKSARVDGFLAGLEIAALSLEAYGRNRSRKRPRKDWIEKTGDVIFGPIR